MNCLSTRKIKKLHYNLSDMAAGRPPNIPRSDLGKRLFEARKRAGLSQKEVAEALGVTQQYVAGWERQGKSLRLELVIRLAKIFNASIDDILGSNNEGESKKITPTGRLRKTFDRASRLSRRQQDKIAEFVEAFVEKYETSKS